jgi:type I restriction enzyme S subunit
LIVVKELIDKATKSLKKLKSYRQSIISEAVTGKIDVRDWQPKKNR